MTRSEAIKKFFNTEGYPPVDTKELLQLGKNNKADFEEIGNLCIQALGAELTVTK